MPRAIQVREDNIDYIDEFARERNFNLDYIRDSMEYNAEEFGWDTYLITDGNEKDNNRTFTMFADVDFRNLWKFKAPEDPKAFVEIERV